MNKNPPYFDMSLLHHVIQVHGMFWRPKI